MTEEFNTPKIYCCDTELKEENNTYHCSICNSNISKSKIERIKRYV